MAEQRGVVKAPLCVLACICARTSPAPPACLVRSLQFKAWLARHGPFGAVIDGANVALYGQNFDTGGFNFGQIQAVVNHLATRHPGLKPLLMLHVGRTKAPQVGERAWHSRG